MGGQVQFRGHLPVAAFVDTLAGAAGQCGSACHPGWRTPWCRCPPITVGPPASAADGQDSSSNFLAARGPLWLYRDMSSRHEMEGIKERGSRSSLQGSRRKGLA